MAKAYIYHHGVKGMKWGVRHDRRKGSVAKRRAAQKKKQLKKKSIKERVKERIAKVDKQKVKDIAKTSAFMVGKVAALAALGSIGYMTVNELSNLYDSHSSENFKSVITTTNDPSYSKGTINDHSNRISITKPLVDTKKIAKIASRYRLYKKSDGNRMDFEITEKFNNNYERALLTIMLDNLDEEFRRR